MSKYYTTARLLYRLHKSPPTRCGRTPKATRPKLPKTKRWQSAARAPKMKPPEAESWLHETAALLIDAMDLAAKQQRRLDLHADSKTKDEYTALLARYERFTQAADK